MWGLKMRVFDSQKVLAVGQTSGSGGWVKKLALLTMEGDGLPMNSAVQKNNEPIELPHSGRQVWFGSLAMAFPPKRILLVSENVGHTFDKKILVFSQTDRPFFRNEMPVSHFHLALA